MKKLLITVVLCCLALTLCSCSKKNDESAKDDVLKILSEEQKKYLNEEAGYTDDALKYMTKEKINYYLLGSGLELYNKTKGVEKYGLTYEVVDKFVMPESTSNELITLDEATEIRLKEDRIRLEDFLKFRYITKNEKDESWVLLFPLKSYKDTYIKLVVKYYDRKLQLSAPIIYYSKKIETDNGYFFSLLYDKTDFENFANESNYSTEDSFFGFVQYGTVTEESLMIKVYNTYDKANHFKTKYKIYEGENITGKVICEGSFSSNSKYEMEKGTYTVEVIYFPSALDKGVYTIDLGDGFIVDTFEVK